MRGSWSSVLAKFGVAPIPIRMHSLLFFMLLQALKVLPKFDSFWKNNAPLFHQQNGKKEVMRCYHSTNGGGLAFYSKYITLFYFLHYMGESGIIEKDSRLMACL